jgi:hypothetical protein
MDMGEEDQAGGVHQQVAFAPEGLLAGVKPAFRGARAGGTRYLRVDHRCRGFTASSRLLACMLAQPVVQAFGRAIPAPAAQL